MFIALAIAFFQQITGINAIFYYLPTIFVQAGGGVNAAFKQAVLVGLVNLGMTFVAIRWVDRLGRKPLLVIGATGMAVSLLTCAWAFHDSNYQITGKVLWHPAGWQGARRPDQRAEGRRERRRSPRTRNLQPTWPPAWRRTHQALPGFAGHRRAEHPRLLVLYAIIGFVASFAISLGPVMWVLLSEIFPNQMSRCSDYWWASGIRS